MFLLSNYVIRLHFCKNNICFCCAIGITRNRCGGCSALFILICNLHRT